MTINAPLDTVNHYGDADVLVIDSIHTNSYHEFGTIASAQIKTGRIVIENKKAKIDNLLLIAKSDKTGFEDIVLETKTDAEMPVLDRTDVIIADKGTLVLNVVTPTTDEFVYLTKAGVIEQVVVTTEAVNTSTTNVTSVASAKIASETSEKTYTVAEQIANVGTKNEDGKYVDSSNNVIELEDLTNVEQIETEVKANPSEVAAAISDFAGGAGTFKSPYIISNLTHWNNLALDGSENGENKYATKGYYFTVVNDLTFGSDFKYLPKFGGHLNFQNHTITCPSDMADEIFILYAVGDTTISNLNVQNNKADFSLVYSNWKSIKFENVNMYGSHIVNGNNSGMFIMFVGLYSDANDEIYVQLNNCNIHSSITGVGTNFVGAYFGTFNYLCDNQVAKVVMKDCTNYGAIMGEKVAMIVSSSASCAQNFVTSWDYAPVVKMYFENVRNQGLLHGNSYSGLVLSMAGSPGYYEYVEGGKTRGTIEFYSDETFNNRIEENNERVKLNDDDTPSILDIKNYGTGSTIAGPFYQVEVNDNIINFDNVKDKNASKYIVSYGWNGVFGAGNGGAFAYTIEIPADQINDAVIYDYEWVNYDTYGDPKAIPATDQSISEITYFGTTLKIDAQNRYVFYKANSQVRTQPTLRVYAFDENNNVIRIGTKDGTQINEAIPVGYIDLVWEQKMLYQPQQQVVGGNYNSFYPGKDANHCTSKDIACSINHQYTLSVSESYADADHPFRFAIVFYNSTTGKITEILGSGAPDVYFGDEYGANTSWTFKASSEESDRFYITGWYIKAENLPEVYSSNITLYAEIVNN